MQSEFQNGRDPNETSAHRVNSTRQAGCTKDMTTIAWILVSLRTSRSLNCHQSPSRCSGIGRHRQLCVGIQPGQEEPVDTCP